MEFKDYLLAIRELGFPIGIAIWLIWIQTKFIGVMSAHMIMEERMLDEILSAISLISKVVEKIRV